MSMNGLFAVLVIEREPSKWSELGSALQSWLDVAGGFALFGLCVYFLYRTVLWLVGHVSEGSTQPLAPVPRDTFNLFCGAAIAFGLWALFFLPIVPSVVALKLQHILQTVGGACALLAVLLPPLKNLYRLRWRRIWALARLSFKEAVHRNKVYWAPTAFILIFLFAGWFLPYKPEDQVRNYVRVVYWAMSPLLLLTAGLLAAFSIPADLRQQTMHTIVTKPVERFEIVLGRCLGFILLMSLVLFGLTALSLVYVARGIDREAAQESYKARVPVFGDLEVSDSENVGREWDYRKYITGGANNQRAIWTFTSVPTSFADREHGTVPCEFYFDIFRTHKGRENRGVRCSFFFENWQYDVTRQNDYTEDRAWVLDRQSAALTDADVRAQAQRENWPADKTQRRLEIAQELRPIIARLRDDPERSLDERIASLMNPLAQRYGYHELRSKEIFDYHTLSVATPTGLFKNRGQKPANDPRPALTIRMRCEDQAQYLGVAKHDLYLLDREGSFALNFFKGALGLWCRICLVIVVAVALSTYFTGVISLLTTLLLYLGGLLIGFIAGVAAGKEVGGGPLESLIRLIGSTKLASELEQTPFVRLALMLDEVFRFFLKLLLHIFPNVERFDLTGYVSQGFDIPVGQLLVDDFIPLLAYTIPWLILGFYMIRSREIAN